MFDLSYGDDNDDGDACSCGEEVLLVYTNSVALEPKQFFGNELAHI